MTINNKDNVHTMSFMHVHRRMKMHSIFYLILLSFLKDAGLGSISLGVLYFSLTFFSIGAPVIVKWLGSKYGILLGMSGYWVFMVANLFPSW